MFLIPTLPTSRVIAETKNNIQVSSPVRDSSYIYISQILNEINVTIRITEAVPMAIPKLLEKTAPYQHKMWHRRSAQSPPMADAERVPRGQTTFRAMSKTNPGHRAKKVVLR